MIQIFRSPSLRQLSDRLADMLRDHLPADPLKPAAIVVPNMDTARWLKLQIAERNGVSANLDAYLPADWFWRQIRKIYPDLAEVLPSDLHPMKWTLFELLGKEGNRKNFDVIERYISSQPEQRREQALFQLCGQIASVFDEYQVYRPDMLLRWQAGKKAEGDEQWQADLWKKLIQIWNRRGVSGQKNRADLYREVMAALKKKEIEPDSTLFIFNPGLLPLPISKMIVEAGKSSDIFFFQITLSKDVKKDGNEILQAYGRESESVDEIVKIIEPNHTQNLYPENPGSKLLTRIQQAVYEGKSVAGLDASSGGNDGIEIRSCHSPLREIEVLHQFLLEAFEQDDSLHPDDVLVATPDLEAYRPYIKAVFDEVEDGLPQIPYHAGYSAHTSEEGIERALIRLMTLIESRFEFTAVLDLFQVNPVYESFGLSDSDVGKVNRWMEENNVVWGLDADHRNEFDQPADELQTWESALRRGWFGHFLGGEKGERLHELLLYPSVQSTGDQEAWAAFSSYLNRLSIMRSEVKRKRTCGQWTQWIEKQMEFIFGREAMQGMEAQSILRITGQIREQCEVGGFGEEIPFSIFKNELSSKLNRQKASGALFTKGITFSSMVPVRSIPFRIVALIGLNENSFPRKRITPDFDLMAQNQLPGERNRKNEDRNLFLESIMAAGEIHYCSFIGQSREDNEEIPPSTIISEWVDILSAVTGKPASEIIKKEALTGYSPANFESNRSYSKTYFEAALNMLQDEDSGPGMIIHRPIPNEEDEQPVRIDDLLRFYNNPVRWFFRSRFEANLKEPDQESDEFSLDHLETHLLFQRVFGWVMNDMSDREIREYLMQSGSVPSGWAGEKELLDLKQNVETALSALREHGIVPAQNFYPVSFMIGKHQLEGSLTSYSQKKYVDISPSGYSGKAALSSWIGHLCAQASGLFEEKESILFSELKKGDPKVKRFRTVQDPSEALAEMVNFYKLGLREPQLFFPKTLYAYEEAVRAGKTEKAIDKAAGEFNNSDFKFGESSDLYIKTALGEDVEFRPEFIEDAHRKIIGRMMDHMEDG